MRMDFDMYVVYTLHTKALNEPLMYIYKLKQFTNNVRSLCIVHRIRIYIYYIIVDHHNMLES